MYARDQADRVLAGLLLGLEAHHHLRRLLGHEIDLAREILEDDGAHLLRRLDGAELGGHEHHRIGGTRRTSGQHEQRRAAKAADYPSLHGSVASRDMTPRSRPGPVRRTRAPPDART